MNIKNLSIIFLLAVTPAIPLALKAQGYPISQVPFTAVHFNDNFWLPRLNTYLNTTLKTCIAQVRDSTARITNFENAAGVKTSGANWSREADDADVYKAMEGMAYSLADRPGPEVEKTLDYWVYLISKAQQPDGYLQTYFTLKEPDKRWTDLGRHEMYCGGHMIEAAVAYYKATGKKTFLDVAVKYVNYLESIFGPGKRHWVPGHEEIELALAKLYSVTNDRKYLEFSKWLLDERGHGYGTGPQYVGNKRSDKYWQDNVPVTEINDAQGHAVRAMYLYSAMADVGAAMKDESYVAALKRVWDDVVLRNMYITGGIGSSIHNEGFTQDYSLPNKTAYCETCASIGMVLWNSRMNMLFADARYADIMEKSMYNAVLAGVSLSGDKFFYVNPLEADGDHHRQRWFGTACCPSNLSRFLPSVGNYLYMTKDSVLFVNLYAGSEASLAIGRTAATVIQKTNYPWDGRITININPREPVNGTVKLRIPEWCKSYSVILNGHKMQKELLESGYYSVTRRWTGNDNIILNLDMPVEMVGADPKVKDDAGKKAVQRGPIIYCVEKADNPGIDLDSLVLSSRNKFKISDGSGILTGVKKLVTKTGKNKITYIPYYAWDNRTPGKMLVWLNYRK